MNKPEKLFPNGPEWELDEYRREWFCQVGALWVTWQFFTEGSHRIYCGTMERIGKRPKSSIAWLRARIIEHRDELVRVTGGDASRMAGSDTNHSDMYTSD